MDEFNELVIAFTEFLLMELVFGLMWLVYQTVLSIFLKVDWVKFIPRLWRREI